MEKIIEQELWEGVWSFHALSGVPPSRDLHVFSILEDQPNLSLLEFLEASLHRHADYITHC